LWSSIIAYYLEHSSYILSDTKMPRLSSYREALEKLGLKQLDVYRYRDRDVIRVLRLVDQKVFVIELPKHREELSLEEFINYVRNKLSSAK